MSKRFFTSDWHLNHPGIIEHSSRPFKSVERMNELLLADVNRMAKSDDVIIHVGDFYCYRSDRGLKTVKIHPSQYISEINANFINIKGNHDVGNKVLSTCDSLTTNVGPYRNCLVSHFPSDCEEYISRAKFRKSIVHLCGHVHRAWKSHYDEERDILNINVGIDVWRYHIVSESDLVTYIESLGMNDPRIDKLLKSHRSK